MPRRSEISSFLLYGSVPIVIGQACEFDYSGTQACKALREEGYSVVLLNSNPATSMPDPETADRTYVEPMTVDSVEKIIEAERPDALLPTIGGQTALNLAVGLAEAGGDGLVLSKEIYSKALENVDAMCEPYASVIDIDSAKDCTV